MLKTEEIKNPPKGYYCDSKYLLADEKCSIHAAMTGGSMVNEYCSQLLEVVFDMQHCPILTSTEFQRVHFFDRYDQSWRNWLKQAGRSTE